MALSQDSTVTIDQKLVMLKDLREFVEVTETWADATIVKVENNGGQIKIEAKFADILR